MHATTYAHEMKHYKMPEGNITYTRTVEGKFDNYWALHQSKLILLKGTRELLPDRGLNSLTTGKIVLLVEEVNCVSDPSVNSTAL